MGRQVSGAGFQAETANEAADRFTNKRWHTKLMREDKIKLPVDIQGEPNWTWMQQYMGELMERADRGYSAVSHIDIELESLVNTASWASYQVGALFEPLESGYIGHALRLSRMCSSCGGVPSAPSVSMLRFATDSITT